MSTIEPRSLVERFLEHGAEGRMDEALTLTHPDLVWTNIGSTRFSGSFEGRDRVVEGLLGPLFGSLEGGVDSTVEAVVAEGEHVVVFCSGRARTRDGRPYDNRYAQHFTVRDGLIVSVTEYMDTALIDATFGPAG